MSDTAFQRKYRQEFIKGFEKRQSLTRHTVTTETEINGNEAIFLVADSGGAKAVTRGVNGDIPTRADNLNQYTATLKEWHDIPERTNFNLYASQGNGRQIMQMTSMGVINRKIDLDIHSALDLGTQLHTMTQGSAKAFLASCLEIKTILAEQYAMDQTNPDEQEPYALITPAFHANLMTLPQFTSADYITAKPFENVSKSRAFNWMGVNYIVDAALPGTGTATANCYLYAKTAVGHACDNESIKTHVGYDEKNDKSWARCSAYMGSLRIQNAGIVKLTHDDTTFIAS